MQNNPEKLETKSEDSLIERIKRGEGLEPLQQSKPKKRSDIKKISGLRVDCFEKIEDPITKK